MAQRTYLQVAQQLVEQLRSEHATPGRRLPPERVLSEQLRVSRPTIREALVALELRGVLETHVGSGTFVINLDADDHAVRNGATLVPDASPRDVLAARLALEPIMVRQAAGNWDRQSIAAIARAVNQVERLAASRSSAHPGEEDRRFHAAIAAATANPVLTELARPLWKLMAQPMWESLKQQRWKPEYTQIMCDEHRAIYDAVRARDHDLAAFEMERHLRHALVSLFDTPDS